MTVDEVLQQCRLAERSGQSRYFAMSYEQGVAAGVQWALGLTDDPPLDPDRPSAGQGTAHRERRERLVYRRPRRR